MGGPVKSKLILFALLASIAGMALADQQEAAKSTPPLSALQAAREITPQKEQIAGISQEYVLGIGDVIEVTVIGVPELVRQEFTLDGQGRISMPYINQVRLYGSTAHDAQIKIAALFEASFLENPQVSVRIKEYKSQYYYVLGAVNKPGRYPMAQPIYLLDALTTAGGLTDSADVQVRIRPGSPDILPQEAGSSSVSGQQEINLAELFYNGDPRRNVLIHTGDTITVPPRKAALYYVMGEVQKQGSYPMGTTDKITISRALANAGGPLKTASAGKSLIIRQVTGSEIPTKIQVDATAILQGKIRDVELQENDIVWIPGSTTKTLGKGFLGGLNGIFGTLLLIGVR
jgi:polysaccharide biosynthesis/export protein